VHDAAKAALIGDDHVVDFFENHSRIHSPVLFMSVTAEQ